jgi:hypothetical protein
MAFTIVTQGSFTSTGVGVKVPLPSSADYFKVQNLTQLATTQGTGRGVMFEWYKNLTPAGAAIEWLKTNSTNAMNLTQVSSGGFTYVETAPIVEAQAAAAITGITAANPAVVTQTNTYSDGDLVRIYNTTGDLTIGGMVFQISSSSGSGYTLLGLPNTSQNGLAAATAGNTRRVSKYAAVDPEYLYITGISNAGSLTTPYVGKSVVSVSVDPSAYYVVGMKVHFSVPTSFGMSQMSGLTGTIVALNVSNTGLTNFVAAYNMVVDIDCSSFTPFTFPASALSPTAQLFATLAPAGAQTSFDPITLVQTGYEFQKQPFHTGQFTPFMYLAAGAQSPAGSTSDVIVWQAYKMEN